MEFASNERQSHARDQKQTVHAPVQRSIGNLLYEIRPVQYVKTNEWIAAAKMYWFSLVESLFVQIVGEAKRTPGRRWECVCILKC